MKNKIAPILVIVLALGILIYDLRVGNQIGAWYYICFGLIIASQLLYFLPNKKKK